MISIQAVCPECGEVTLPADAMTVVMPGVSEDGTYSFECPECDAPVIRHADIRTIQVLATGGARVRVPQVPLEALEEHDGPPLCLDDVLDFHLLLERDDWFEQLTAGLGERPKRPGL